MALVAHGFTAGEIIKTGRISQQQLDFLRQWTEKEDLPKFTDEQLVLFSLSCFNEVEDTQKTIKSFVSTRNGCPSLFSNRKIFDEKLQDQLTVTDYSVFPRRTKDDCVVISHRLNNTHFRRYDMEVAMKLLFMTLDAAVFDHPPKGLVILFDMRGVGLLHLTRVKLHLVKVFFQFLQEALPVRLRKIHVLNSVYFLEKVIALIKPFIKKEVMDMVSFYPCSMTMDELHELLPKDFLPEDYGGNLPPIRTLHEMNIQKLISMQSYFDAEEQQRKPM